MKKQEVKRLAGDMRTIYDRKFKSEKEVYRFKPEIVELIPKGVESDWGRMVKRGKISKAKVRLFTK